MTGSKAKKLPAEIQEHIIKNPKRSEPRKGDWGKDILYEFDRCFSQSMIQVTEIPIRASK